MFFAPSKPQLVLKNPKKSLKIKNKKMDNVGVFGNGN